MRNLLRKEVATEKARNRLSNTTAREIDAHMYVGSVNVKHAVYSIRRK